MGQRLPAEAQGETSTELVVLLPRPRLVASLQGQIEQGSFFPQPRLASGWHVSTFRSLLHGSAGGSKTLALPWGHPYDEGSAELSLCWGWEQRTEAASPSSPLPRRCSRQDRHSSEAAHPTPGLGSAPGEARTSVWVRQSLAPAPRPFSQLPRLAEPCRLLFGSSRCCYRPKAAAPRSPGAPPGCVIALRRSTTTTHPPHHFSSFFLFPANWRH